MSWIIGRIRERSSHHGATAVIAAAAVIWGGFALMDVIVWGALAWGVWNILRSE